MEFQQIKWNIFETLERNWHNIRTFVVSVLYIILQNALSDY